MLQTPGVLRTKPGDRLPDTPMRVAELTVIHARIRLRKPIRHASHSREANDTLLVKCVLNDGTVGWGEGLPRDYVTGETIDSAFAQATSARLTASLAGEFSSIADAIEFCDQMEFDGAPPNARDCFGNTVRCAVELSVLDGVCRTLSLPLSSVTSLLAPENLRSMETAVVRYSGAVTSDSRWKQQVQALKMRLFAFQQIKVKVGAEGVNDVNLLRRVRRVVGHHVDIRIDANEAWTCDTLEEKLAPLLPFGISCLEQPVPHADVDGLRAIRSRISTPVMLDESLCSLGDARRAITAQTCDLFNIRLSKCGGFINSVRMACMAREAGLGFQLGCLVGETGILSAAGRHFATSVSDIRFLEGSYDGFLVRERLTRENLTFKRGGRAPALPGPGLGISVDDRAVKRVTVRSVKAVVHPASR